MELDSKERQKYTSLKIVITGALGFIGPNLVEELSKEKNYKIICLVRKGSDTSILDKYGVKIVECNLLDKNSFKTIMNDVDIVVHLAAIQ